MVVEKDVAFSVNHSVSRQLEHVVSGKELRNRHFRKLRRAISLANRTLN